MPILPPELHQAMMEFGDLDPSDAVDAIVLFVTLARQICFLRWWEFEDFVLATYDCLLYGLLDGEWDMFFDWSVAVLVAFVAWVVVLIVMPGPVALMAVVGLAWEMERLHQVWLVFEDELEEDFFEEFEEEEFEGEEPKGEEFDEEVDTEEFE
ncbi:hypothetical protein PV04_10302 [Phialophora macrospora]|uniref:Uncharacterized protein n=1 Tax=Phialophora macrospora TaxID=1851006 RepID=A0A0D2CEF6_9EURO|nr:hypothetical protein PV04_10302 [Phialophora macrospora]